MAARYGSMYKVRNRAVFSALKWQSVFVARRDAGTCVRLAATATQLWIGRRAAVIVCDPDFARTVAQASNDRVTKEQLNIMEVCMGECRTPVACVLL